MNKTMILYTIIYLGSIYYRLFLKSSLFSRYNLSRYNLFGNFFDYSIVFSLIYWIYKNRKNLKEFLNSFREDVRQGKLVYTFKQFFSLKRLFLGRLRHENISLESIEDKDANRIFSVIKNNDLKGYSLILNNLRTKEEIKDFINISLEEYKNFSSINFKIVYNTIFYIPFGPKLVSNFSFRRMQKFYKKFIYKFEKRIISLPIINFIDKDNKIVTLEWNFDSYYEKYEKMSLNKLVKLLFNKMKVSKINVSLFKEDIDIQKLFEEIGFKENYQENNLITYELINSKRN